jgi:hypothetical protein
MPEMPPSARADALYSPIFALVGLAIAVLGPFILGSGFLSLEGNTFQAVLYLVLLVLVILLIRLTLHRIFLARAQTLRRIVSSLRWDWEFVACGLVVMVNILTVNQQGIAPAGDSWRMYDVLWEGMKANMVSYFTGIMVILTFITSGLPAVAHNQRIRPFALLDLLWLFAYLFTHILILPIIDVRGLEQGFLDPLFVALVKSVTYCAYILSALRFYRYLIYYIIEYFSEKNHS